MVEQPPDRRRRCAVIYNPIKVSDGFRDRVSAALDAGGWSDTLWFETTEADPGRGQVAEAVAAKPVLVIGAGGDGTVRIVADGLADTGIPLGVIPAGTANLLARNLSLPQDEAGAIKVALGDATRTIDLVSLSADGGRPEHFAVMAGAGVDAMIMDETDPDLKAKVGPAAYFVAAGKALGRLPIRFTVQIDNQRPRHRKAMLVVVANVGGLPGGLNLVPEAVPDDGLLNVFIASPRRFGDWVKVVVRLITRRRKGSDPLDSFHGRRVRIGLTEPDNYQLDGDVAGTCAELVAEVRPGALIVHVEA
jgi:diacylglycerol kinase (ATP)